MILYSTELVGILVQDSVLYKVQNKPFIIIIFRDKSIV